MKESLLDTDILSFYFKGNAKVVSNFQSYLENHEQINISIITYFEILGGLKFKNAITQINEFDIFVDNNNLIHLTEQSIVISTDIYAELRKKGTTIGTSDLLIAGIAIENDLVLVTNNEKHFSLIKNLKTKNWSK